MGFQIKAVLFTYAHLSDSMSPRMRLYVHLLGLSFQRAVRARRGDDARAERCLRVGCDKTALRSVLGFHVADFPLVLPHNTFPSYLLLLQRGCHRPQTPSRRTREHFAAVSDMVQPDAFSRFVPPPRSLAFNHSNNRSVVVLGLHMRKCAGTAVRRMFADTGAWGAVPYCPHGGRDTAVRYGRGVAQRQQWGPDADRLLFWERPACAAKVVQAQRGRRGAP